jgi:hypothetical protein
MRSVEEKIRELNEKAENIVDARNKNGPRNHLGEPATKTSEEAIARLQEKAVKNHGGANRERIAAQISEEQRARKRESI